MHLLASTLSVGTAGAATILSHTCEIPSFKDNQIARDNHLPVQTVSVGASRRERSSGR